MTNGTLQATALAVLRKPGISKINFDLNGLIVAGHRYASVAALIGSGKIACEAVAKMPVPPGQQPPKGYVVGAMYKPEANTMYFSRDDYGNSNAFERSTILHETTHAIFDAFARSKDDRVLGIDDESAAILAQALYLRLCEPDSGGVATHRFSMSIDGPGEHALKLADRMIDETGNFEKDKRTYKLKPEQMVRFRQAVAKEWGLIKETLADGTISDRTGAQTIYDGVATCFSCWGQTFRPGQSAGAAMQGGAGSLGTHRGLWDRARGPTGQNAGAATQGSSATPGTHRGLWDRARGPTGQNAGAPKQGSATSPSTLFPKR